MATKIHGVGVDAPVVANDRGGRQSHVPYRCDLFPPQAFLAVAGVLAHGAAKYGVNNWHAITVDEHLNHAISHLFALLAGDGQDDHLEHAACRVLMALEQKLTGRPESLDECDAAETFTLTADQLDDLRLYDPADTGDVDPGQLCDASPTPSRKPRVYITGPITRGDLAANVNAATDAFLKLMRAGYAPFCPHWSVYAGGCHRGLYSIFALAEALPADTTYDEWMGVDLPWVAAADVLLRLPGASMGADAEVHEARAFGVPVFFGTADEFLAHEFPADWFPRPCDEIPDDCSGVCS